ncbi:MAG TPA: hypothetical protein VF103_07155, partial [Polyangiaceae bacterium]
MHHFEEGQHGFFGQVAPSHRHAKASPGLIKRATGSFEPEAGVPSFRAEPFREVQRHATEGPTKLRPKLTVPPRDAFDERPSESNDLDCVFENVLVEVSVHAPSRMHTHLHQAQS